MIMILIIHSFCSEVEMTSYFCKTR